MDLGTLQGADEYIGIDPEAYDFDTYITEEVPYGVYNDYWYYENSEGGYDSDGIIYPHNLILYGNYYYLSDTGLESEADINQRIFEEAVRAADHAEYIIENRVLYSQLDVYSTSYVTYMDESVISIAYYVTAYYTQHGDTDGDEDNMYSLGTYISAVSFDLKTGKEIKASEVFDFGGDFVKTFKERCYEQNGSPIDYYSDAELEKILLSDDEVFWAYTPLGLEVGVNRPKYTGWSTGTFTNFEAFLK